MKNVFRHPLLVGLAPCFVLGMTTGCQQQNEREAKALKPEQQIQDIQNNAYMPPDAKQRAIQMIQSAPKYSKEAAAARFRSTPNTGKP